ncbi:hypothetical protein [Kitasatospora sp. NPDC096204]|uniref:hypothetical protein n=1 Tax=Kitasatospora sp. NPDC096204 TaxID=3364094 RepID=UPI00381BFAC6
MARPDGRVRRFTTAERMVHRATAALMVLCVATAACLYIGSLAQAVGRRYLMATAHEWSGILLPVHGGNVIGLVSRPEKADVAREAGADQFLGRFPIRSVTRRASWRSAVI